MAGFADLRQRFGRSASSYTYWAFSNNCNPVGTSGWLYRTEVSRQYLQDNFSLVSGMVTFGRLTLQLSMRDYWRSESDWKISSQCRASRWIVVRYWDRVGCFAVSVTLETTIIRIRKRLKWSTIYFVYQLKLHPSKFLFSFSWIFCGVYCRALLLNVA